MSLEALILFGSRARGDHELASDIDIMGISSTEEMISKSFGNINIVIYPLDYLMKKASSGDLFVCHVITEGKILYDPVGYFCAIKENFKVKTLYEEEIEQAVNHGYFLISNYSKFKSTKSLNRKIAWCVRTILIAKSVEKNRLVFSRNEIIIEDKSGLAAMLISNKDNDSIIESTISKFAKFLRLNGFSEPDFIYLGIPYISEFFRRTRNSFALKTLQELIGKELSSGYTEGVTPRTAR